MIPDILQYFFCHVWNFPKIGKRSPYFNKYKKSVGTSLNNHDVAYGGGPLMPFQFSYELRKSTEEKTYSLQKYKKIWERFENILFVLIWQAEHFKVFETIESHRHVFRVRSFVFEMFVFLCLKCSSAPHPTKTGSRSQGNRVPIGENRLFLSNVVLGLLFLIIPKWLINDSGHIAILFRPFLEFSKNRQKIVIL